MHLLKPLSWTTPFPGSCPLITITQHCFKDHNVLGTNSIYARVIKLVFQWPFPVPGVWLVGEQLEKTELAQRTGLAAGEEPVKMFTYFGTPLPISISHIFTHGLLSCSICLLFAFWGVGFEDVLKND